MRDDGRTGDAGGGQSDLVGVGLDAELGDVGQPVVERALVPEAVFAATDAAVARGDGERDTLVPARRRAGVVGGRALAAHLVQAVARLGAFVVPLLDELPGVEMRPAVALVVDALAVEHLRPALPVEFGNAVEGGDVGHHRRHHLGDRRAARHLDDRLVGDHLVDRHGVGRIRLGGLHAAPRRAGTPGDHGLGILGHMLELVGEGPAAGHAEHAVFTQRRVAFDGQDVIALVLLHHLLERGLGLVPGRGHDGVVVVERDHRQDHVLGQRMRRADERLGAAGALQAVQPEHGRSRLGLQRMRDGRREGRPQAQRSSRQAAELHVAAAGDSLPAHDFVEGLGHRASLSGLGWLRPCAGPRDHGGAVLCFPDRARLMQINLVRAGRRAAQAWFRRRRQKPVTRHDLSHVHPRPRCRW